MNRFVIFGLVVSALLVVFRIVLRRQLRKPEPTSIEHAVLVHLRLSSGTGTSDEVSAIRELSRNLDRVIRESGAGELDGDEFGGGECVLYMYGPNADMLFNVVSPVLRASPLTVKGWVLKRYGDASDESVRSERVDL